MPKHYHTVAGTEFAPLPFQSSLSVLLTFCWRNSMKSAQLAKIGVAQRGYPSSGCYPSLSWLQSEKIFELTGWILPGKDEIEFANGKGLDRSLWFRRLFSYCPLCLEQGYHSFFHQLADLNCCPLHGIPLSSRCHSCGAGLPNFYHSPRFYDSPFLCSKCGLAISGVMPNLTLHRSMRDQEQDIRRAFSSLMTWWRETRSVRALYERKIDGGAWPASGLAPWIHVPELVRSLSLLSIKAPDNIKPPTYHDITILKWNLQILHVIEKRHFISRRRNWHQRIAMPTAVYRCVLRSLTRWICEVENWSLEEFNFHQINMLPPTSAHSSVRLIAFMCLRRCMEETWILSAFNDFRRARLYDEPAIDLKANEDHVPRLAWYAFFIGLYAYWYHRVERSIAKRKLDLKFGYRSEGYLVLIDDSVEPMQAGFRSTGSVVFPTIPGFEKVLKHRKNVQFVTSG